MTALFATAETFTASTALGAIATYAPAEMAMEGPAGAHTGVRADLSGQMAILADLPVSAGAYAGFADAEMTIALDIVPSSGAAIAWEAMDYALQVEAFAASGGGLAALVTDVIVVEQPPTAAFSTGMAEWPQTLLRMQHSAALAHDLSAGAGATAPVDGEMQIEPDDHGPVARPRAVQAQIIMS